MASPGVSASLSFATLHAALHADAMVAVAETAIGFRELGFSRDDAVGDEQEHGAGLLGEIGMRGVFIKVGNMPYFS